MKKYCLVIPILLLVTLACNVALPQTKPTTEPTTVPTIDALSTPTQTESQQGQSGLPLTEADVPRVKVSEAKRAFGNGEAVMLDVRSAEAYATGHLQGAISIPLVEIENNVENLPLKKDQWIITYCT